MTSWPAALRLETRKILDGILPFPEEGILPMKNINHFSAYLKQADLQKGHLILYDAETQLATCFQNAGEMFDAGWIADLQANSQFRLRTGTDAMIERSALANANEKESVHALGKGTTRVVSLKTGKAKERA